MKEKKSTSQETSSSLKLKPSFFSKAVKEVGPSNESFIEDDSFGHKSLRLILFPFGKGSSTFLSNFSDSYPKCMREVETNFLGF